jgi:hypothetical protein
MTHTYSCLLEDHEHTFMYCFYVVLIGLRHCSFYLLSDKKFKGKLSCLSAYYDSLAKSFLLVTLSLSPFFIGKLDTLVGYGLCFKQYPHFK